MCSCDPDYEFEDYVSCTLQAIETIPCAECNDTIQKMDKFNYASGVDSDGNKQIFYTCLPCARVWRFMADELDCECLLHGGLSECLHEHMEVAQYDWACETHTLRTILPDKAVEFLTIFLEDWLVDDLEEYFEQQEYAYGL